MIYREIVNVYFEQYSSSILNSRSQRASLMTQCNTRLKNTSFALWYRDNRAKNNKWQNIIVIIVIIIIIIITIIIIIIIIIYDIEIM